MVPVNAQGEAIDLEFMSHKKSSHTFEPRILAGPTYEKYKELNGYYLVDFPGCFDSKGKEFSLGIDLALKKIIKASKSTKIILLVPATHLNSDNVSTI